MATGAATASGCEPALVAAPPRKKVELPYPVLSPSQISLYDDGKVDGGSCKRKWGFKYLLKLEDPKGAAAALGDDVDSGQLQPYLVEGKPIDFTRKSGNIADTAMPWLPKPKTPGLVCQHHFWMPTFTGPGAGTDKARFGYQGYMDMHAPSSAIMPDTPPADSPLAVAALGSGGIVPFVGDFKTTGSWNYRKRPEALKTDIQATVYAKWAMWHYGVDVVDLAWLYMRTKPSPKGERSFLRTTKDIVDARFEGIEAVAVEMFDARRGMPVPYVPVMGDSVEWADPITNTPEWIEMMPARNRARIAANKKLVEYVHTFEPNVNSCDSFNGCPYQAHCDLSPDLVVDALEARDVRAGRAFRPSSTRSVPDPKAEADFVQFLADTINDTESLKETTTQMSEAAPAKPKNKFLAQMQMQKTEIESALTNAPPAAPPAAPSAGINPPEKDLPPADPIGSVKIPDVVAEAPKEPKVKKLTKKELKAQADATAAQINADTTTTTTTTALVPNIPTPKIELVTFGPAKGPSEEGMQFPCRWGEERYMDFGSGYSVATIEITGTVRKGETYEEAYLRTHERLGVLASKLRLKQKAAWDSHAPDSPYNATKKSA